MYTFLPCILSVFIIGGCLSEFPCRVVSLSCSVSGDIRLPELSGFVFFFDSLILSSLFSVDLCCPYFIIYTDPSMVFLRAVYPMIP
jgi:hypothetical protein